MVAKRLVLLLSAGTAMLALTGCTQSANVAARVGGATVPNSDVDFLTRMQCATLDRAAQDPAQAQQGVQTAAKAQIRTAMVNTLVEAELNHQLARQQHLSYDRSTLRSAMDQFESVVKQVPVTDQKRFRDLVESIYRGQLEVYTLAQKNLQAQGSANPSQNEVDGAVSAIEGRFRKTVDVEINPEYGADANGIAGKADPSLSVPVSSFAKQSTSAQPDQAWVAKLPAAQRCG